MVALGRSRHNGRILVTDGNYPVTSGAPAATGHVFLNLASGLLDITRILEALKHAVPIERAGLIVPAAGVVGIEAPEVILVHDEYRAALSDVVFNEISRRDFYDVMRTEGVAVVIVSADQRLYANLLLTIGVHTPDKW